MKLRGMKRLGVLVLLLLVALVVDLTAAQQENGTEASVETFQQVEKNFKNAVGNLVKRILPYIMENGDNDEVSGPCKSSVMRIIGGVRQLREWAMRFVDASGKIPPGILEGTTFSVGDYDECLDLEVGKRDDPPKTPEQVMFRGQYCLLEAHRPEAINRAVEEYQNGNKDAPIAKTKTLLNMFIKYKHLSNTTFKWGVCVPSKCSPQDMENILKSDDLKSFGKITVFYCKQKEKEEKSAEIILLLCLFGFVLGIMVIGTIVDAVLRLRSKEKKIKECSPYIKYMEQVSSNTSLYTNAIDVLSTKTQESIRTLCGVRTIVVLLTIYSHAYGHIHQYHFQKFSRSANFLRFFDSFTFSGIANGSVSVDTIFLIAGITITYTRWRHVSEKSKVNLKLCSLLLKRYFRMGAAQLLVICVFLLFPIYGSGPFWKPYMDDELRNCRQRWWLNILFVNNFFKTDTTCIYHTWVLAVIMQLTLLSAIILWVLKHSLRFGIFVMISLILSGIIGVGVVTAINKLPGSMAFYMLDLRSGPITWRDVYILPYDHVGPFCIGLLSGYILARKKDKLNIRRCTSIVIWCLSTACSSAVMFGLYSYRNGAEIELSLSTFYAVTHRIVWALGIAWLIIACSTRHGGAVARVLHSEIFVPLDRLCYLAFILHIPIMYYHSGILRERWFMGHFELLFLALGYIILSFTGSFMLHIIFVKPYFAIEDCVSSFFHTKRKMSVDLKINVQDKKDDASAISETTVSSTGCVNVAYSKKLDGL